MGFNGFSMGFSMGFNRIQWDFMDFPWDFMRNHTKKIRSSKHG
jgi:hypothetical protein